jgi:hypothetical protein
MTNDVLAPKCARFFALAEIAFGPADAERKVGEKQ